ncbi:sensor histidine kinase [Carnobacterium gallinarum]|uniref:sensor histidine kinase n=1 Tax=Carnobacterium gallinarum TaxID=2749 RepID=UPI000556330C|nr:HAMP domain-containing sensor histidine kinase [Carnobacterium gallinarum]
MKKTIEKKQQRRFFIYNMISFALIFLAFGFIIYFQVQNSLYSGVDRDLLRQAEIRGAIAGAGSSDETNRLKEPPVGELDKLPNPVSMPKGQGRFVPIEWDAQGDILNKDEIGTQLADELSSDFKLTTSKLETVQSVTLSSGSSFRYVVYKAPSIASTQVRYIQFISRVDAEKQLAENFGRILIICSISFWILSIFASYYLSQKAMSPILASWKKQTEFVANASHELRTPLTIIQNKLELLLTKPNERIIDQMEPIALSLSEIRHLTKMTSDLLLLSRADSNATMLTKEKVQLNHFIAEIIEPYQEIAASLDMKIWTNLESDAFAEIDPVRIQQLLVILLDNSLKYSSAGDSIGIITSVSEHHWQLEVRDTGQGIDKENREKIFERFYREEKSRNRETGGTGLGLSIAKWIVELHHGKMNVLENEPKGSIFQIRLPLK